jgi:hypothetical protein
MGANLILDWTATVEREILLALSKPIGVWKYRAAPKIEWRLPVVLAHEDELRFEATEETVDVEPRFNLDELNEEPGKGE